MKKWWALGAVLIVRLSIVIYILYARAHITVH